MKNPTAAAVPASALAKHGGLGVLVGALSSLVVAGGQIMFNTGLSPQIPTTAGVIALLVSLAHSAYALMQNNTVVKQEIGTLESRLGLSPALLAQLEPLIKQWLAPVLAAELMKIKTPPAAALKPQQPVQQVPQPQPVQQQPVQLQYNPMQNAASGYGAVSQVPDISSQIYNLQTQQMQQVQPGQGYPGHGG